MPSLSRSSNFSGFLAFPTVGGYQDNIFPPPFLQFQSLFSIIQTWMQRLLGSSHKMTQLLFHSCMDFFFSIHPTRLNILVSVLR